MNYSIVHGIGNVTPEFLSMIKLPDQNGKKLNYLMVLPKTSINDDSPHGFPVGFALVTAALKASGRCVSALNLNYKSDPEYLLKQIIVDNQIGVVMTGGMGVQFWNIKLIIDAVKEINPDLVTVVGGSLITADPETSMAALENADYGVIGEGEITINALAYALENGHDPAFIDGIICKRNGRWSVREKWSPIPDIDILPFPDYSGLEYEQLLDTPNRVKRVAMYFESSSVAYVSISRSCPAKCTFCFHSCGDLYRHMSMDKAFELIDWTLSQYTVEVIWIMDEMTFPNEKFALEFCRRIKAYNKKWKCSIRANMVSENMLMSMKDSGCELVTIGIESASNKILKSMRKGITIEQVESLLRIAEKIGLTMKGTLIFGDPEETMETFWISVYWYQKWRNSNAFFIYLDMIGTFPGSHNYKVACDRGIIKDRVQFLKDGFPLVNISKMTDDEYNLLPALLRIFNLRNKLKNVRIEPQSDYTLNITGQCPHCLNTICFKHFESAFNIDPQLCPECGKDVSLYAIEYVDLQKLSTSADALIKGVSAAVWAVTPYNFHWLLKSMPALRNDNVKFINQNNITVSGMTAPGNGHIVKAFEGKKIYTPDIIHSAHIDTVIVPNSPKVFSEIKAQCLAEFPGVKRIIHLTELIG